MRPQRDPQQRSRRKTNLAGAALKSIPDSARHGAGMAPATRGGSAAAAPRRALWPAGGHGVGHGAMQRRDSRGHRGKGRGGQYQEASTLRVLEDCACASRARNLGWSGGPAGLALASPPNLCFACRCSGAQCSAVLHTSTSAYASNNASNTDHASSTTHRARARRVLDGQCATQRASSNGQAARQAAQYSR